jgi:peroxiredoxin
MQLVKLQQEYSVVKSLNSQVLAISTDNLQGAGWAVDQQGLEFPVLYNPQADIIKKYGVFNASDAGRANPSTFIIDKDGNVRWQYIGQGISDRPSNNLIFEQIRIINDSEQNNK